MRRFLLLALLLTGLAVPARAATPAPTIQPGMQVDKAGEAWCTGGFVFNGTHRLRGRYYLGLAAHCFEHEIGAVVQDAQGKRIGRLVYSHWTYSTFADDIALVELDRSVYGRISPEVAGRPGMPTGIGNGENITVGDPVGVSGHGFATNMSQRTRERRVGVLENYGKGLWGADTVVSNGDSGGPVVDLRSGAAVGSISNYCVPAPVYTSDGYVPGCTGYGPNLEQFVRLATHDGFPIALRTAREGRVRG